MRLFRILMNGAILLISNLGGILFSHILCQAMGVGYQLGIRLPLAAVLSTALYLAWIFLLRSLRLKRLVTQTQREAVFAGLCSLLWNPLIFIPLHFATQNYLSSAANIFALMAFQVPVNALAISIVWLLGTRAIVNDAETAKGSTAEENVTQR